MMPFVYRNPMIPWRYLWMGILAGLLVGVLFVVVSKQLTGPEVEQSIQAPS
jgi:ABC-type uncharacterized transport system permease subunit